MSRLQHRLSSIVIAAVIGLLQGIAFSRLLTESLPYKEMTLPSAGLFALLSKVLAVVCPASACAAGALISRRHAASAPLISSIVVVLLAFAVVGVVMFSAKPPIGYSEPAPDFSARAALLDFAFWSAAAAFAGCVCGALVWPILHFVRPKVVGSAHSGGAPDANRIML